MDTAFIRATLTDWRVGGFLPTSRRAATALVRPVWPHDRYVIEYGAGTGMVTRAILQRFDTFHRRDVEVVAVELHPGFITKLYRIDDPRLRVVHEDAITVSKQWNRFVPKLDVVISSIPLTYLSSYVREAFVRNIYAALAPGGRLLVYQHWNRYFALIDEIFCRCTVTWSLWSGPVPYQVILAEKV